MEECGLLVQKAEQMRKEMNMSRSGLEMAVKMVGTISTSASDSVMSQEEDYDGELVRVIVDSDEAADGRRIEEENEVDRLREGEISILAKEQKELLRKLQV